MSCFGVGWFLNFDILNPSNWALHIFVYKVPIISCAKKHRKDAAAVKVFWPNTFF